jgi:nitric oxide synthase oxygenase domain/subunit
MQDVASAHKHFLQLSSLQLKKYAVLRIPQARLDLYESQD